MLISIYTGPIHNRYVYNYKYCINVDGMAVEIRIFY